MTTIEHVSRDQLLNRKAAILAKIGLSEDELRARAESGGLVGDEWAAASAIEGIDYLLGDD
jgi:hypothetical protein